MVLVFIIGYSMMLFGDSDDTGEELSEPQIPELEVQQEEYHSKLDAINDLKEVRQTNAPSIYDEKLWDSSGVFDPDLLEKEKMHMVDSIYKHGRIDYTKMDYRGFVGDSSTVYEPINNPYLEVSDIKPSPGIKEMALEQQLFFASAPKVKKSLKDTTVIYALANGSQMIKANDRLELRTIEDAFVDGVLVPKNTILYGIVSFKPNRVLLEIENINHKHMPLKAYDTRDGMEGIFIKNSFQAEATKEIIGDVIDDINIPGVPQISGLKKIFQRSNRSVRVTIHDNYSLILKPVKDQLNNPLQFNNLKNLNK